MFTTFLILSLTFIALGSAFLIFPKQIGIAFCKGGKWTWKKLTFGLTDVRWFYREEGAPFIFRCVGAGFVFFGLLFLLIVSLSFFGPGTLFAMREADAFLRQQHPGISGGMKISAQKEDPAARRVRINYQFEETTGLLMAEWDGDKYRFTRIK